MQGVLKNGITDIRYKVNAFQHSTTVSSPLPVFSVWAAPQHSRCSEGNALFVACSIWPRAPWTFIIENCYIQQGNFLICIWIFLWKMDTANKNRSECAQPFSISCVYQILGNGQVASFHQEKTSQESSLTNLHQYFWWVCIYSQRIMTTMIGNTRMCLYLCQLPFHLFVPRP